MNDLKKLNTVPERLKHFREMKGLNRAKFAEKLGLLPDTYRKLENGVNNLTESNLINLKRVFGISADWILFGVGEILISDKPEGIDGHDFGPYNINVRELLKGIAESPAVLHNMLAHFHTLKKRLTLGEIAEDQKDLEAE